MAQIKTAFILAAGLGSRLGPLTADRPKALVEITPGVPVIDLVIKQMIAAGVTKFVLNLYYFGDQIRDFIAEQNYSAQFFYSAESELLDTGGGLLNAASLLAEDQLFYLLNCDVLHKYSLHLLASAAMADKSSLATLAVTKQQSSRHLLFDHAMQLAGTANSLSGQRLVLDTQNRLMPFDYRCLAVINQRIFSYADKIEDQKIGLFDLLLRARKEQDFTRGFEYALDLPWVDIGTPKDLEAARENFC